MKTNSLIILAISVCFFMSCSKRSEQIELKKWQLTSKIFADTFKIDVPNNIHLNLRENGIIDDPFYGQNENKLQWIDTIDWTYETKFNVPQGNLCDNDHHELVFEGIDTYAEIILNDSVLDTVNNMYRKWIFDVKGKLRAVDNNLKVKILSSKEYNLDQANKLSYKLPDDRVFSRKAPYHFGWDWGPEFVTSGIWQPVYLNFWSNVKYEHFFVQTNSISDEKATMNLSFEANSTKDLQVAVIIKVNDDFILQKDIKLDPGVMQINIPFTLNDPKLWWSHDLGEPNLYKFDIVIISDAEEINKEMVTGIRTIELIEEPDSIGKSFKFRLNGKDLFIRGANYIPQDNFLTRVDYERYKKLLNSVVEVNMNMLRVWGGGIYENEHFYHLCDSMGILVWQDFMFACAIYPGDDVFLENVSNEIEYQIRRLRNHPSIALWCGNNEVDNGWKDWGWQNQLGYSVDDSTQIWNDYEKLFHEIIPHILIEKDSTRPYWPSSPKFGWGHEIANQEGDSHYWGVWWGEEPFEVFYEKVPRFMSEYGFQAFPVISAIDSFSKPEDQYLYSKTLKLHQKHPRGFEIIDKYMDWYFPKTSEFEEYIYTSQLLQSYGMEIAIETHRLNKPYCMGTLYWQLNDCWPVISWSTIDYYGNWKASHYELKNAYNDILIANKDTDQSVQLYLVSDNINRIDGDFSIKIIDFKGNELSIDSKETSIENESVLLYEIEKGKFEQPENLVIYSEFVTSNGELYKSYDHFVHPKGLHLLNPEIAAEIIQAGGKYFVKVKAKYFAKSVMIQIYENSYQFSDNFFDMLPGEEKMVEILNYSGQLSNPKIKVLSLNAIMK